MPDNSTPPVLLIPATPPTFAEYQLIHQTQERQRHPNPESTRPVTSDPWSNWLKGALVLAGSFGFYSITGGGVVFMAFGVMMVGLGLLHQLWEYRRAFREQQARPQPESLEFSEAGLRLHYPLGTVFHTWDSLYRVREIGDWLLLYPDMEFCYYLNLQRLPEPLTAADVRASVHWRDMRFDKAKFAV
ncbi:YcxB family protein [Hymenobacter sp. ISL-91]|uniref:hypothetical protein n=1 Tax=Hymenobacter sp. ISL-91 TaxID=2819151 RepID=UPI001BE793E7|nr:hypothetical protein [Hymenobacter sp. ISL-91]MBT2556560.1 YcxB family protein [Hymenobacter sp. ISL-91]